MPNIWSRLTRAAALLLLVSGLAAGAASAQMPITGASGDATNTTPVLPTELTREAIRDVLAELDDA